MENNDIDLRNLCTECYEFVEGDIFKLEVFDNYDYAIILRGHKKCLEESKVKIEESIKNHKWS